MSMNSLVISGLRFNAGYASTPVNYFQERLSRRYSLFDTLTSQKTQGTTLPYSRHERIVDKRLVQ
jgi:hypothetical protein